ncbi:FadR/GntR family transcriptional regulator [Actinoalloteichus hymeniacidonis]|uniref:Transcriptional regulator n=1 Tax=Actinoalloteichus hymeniacidonis TaxID=340345 RepID=A0AAC9HQ97_9PSEU|nr:FCD domain-containing protein [Actinoalloteichus hymeniacidonis]AOS62615.1 transcriptional regulator [Actinoalloteichus hymeniacidonis]MBB5909353.1 DNA-binding FadR family transcriptional regulator [Actinoalloteichus hymeniacidonis]
MPLATTRRTGLVDQVIAQLRVLIVEGEWSIGSRIPTEPELVEALGVGRNTVREAVRALAHAGLLEVRQGDGTYVRATSELSGAVRRLYTSELRDVLETRRAIEVEAARLAAARRTEEELALLTETLGRRDAALAAAEWEAMVRADTEFHAHVVEASHNSLLTELYAGFTEAVMASVATGVAIDNAATCVEHVSHSALLAAIRDGDPAAAAREAGGFLNEQLDRLGEAEDSAVQG